MDEACDLTNEIDEENKLIQQMEVDFEVLDKYIDKCRTLLEKRKKYVYPTKLETDTAINSLENLTLKEQEIANDTKLLVELLKFARNRDWKHVKNMVFSVCMEMDAVECKYLKRDGVVSVLNKPDSVELANFDVWKECENPDFRNGETDEEFDDETDHLKYASLPTKIAKQFCSLYDTKWSEAFNQINVFYEREKENEDIIKDIAVITKLVFEYIKEKVKVQMENMVLAMTKVVLEPIKPKRPKAVRSDYIECKSVLPFARLAVQNTADNTLPILLKDFTTTQFPKRMKTLLVLDKVVNLIEKCAQIAWQIYVIEPPMALLWPTETSKENLFYYFRYFTKFGTELEHGVWPALLLHNDGPIMVRGVVQLK